MARCRVDKSLQRTEIDGIAFPLGVYPVEELKPKPGYTLAFEPGDGAEETEWEEWPDRYVFDIFLSATRVESLCRSLFAMLPGRVYPILDVLGHDEYREVDPYVAYELVSQERFLDAVRRFRGFLFEDGLVGFGVISEEPFIYVFVDEHKIVTVRVETALRDKVESLLAAFDLTEIEEIAGADAATHEHRGVLDAPEDRPDLLTSDEIVEELRDECGLVLNIDPESNVDDDGTELGLTAWRCIARHEPNDEPSPVDTDPKAADPSKGEKGVPAGSEPTGSKRLRYAEVYLCAECLSAAERMLWDAMEQLTGKERAPDAVDTAVSMDRIRPENLVTDLESLGARKKGEGPIDLDQPRILHTRWLD